MSFLILRTKLSRDREHSKDRKLVPDRVRNCGKTWSLFTLSMSVWSLDDYSGGIRICFFSFFLSFFLPLSLSLSLWALHAFSAAHFFHLVISALSFPVLFIIPPYPLIFSSPLLSSIHILQCSPPLSLHSLPLSLSLVCPFSPSARLLVRSFLPSLFFCSLSLMLSPVISFRYRQPQPSTTMSW